MFQFIRTLKADYTELFDRLNMMATQQREDASKVTELALQLQRLGSKVTLLQTELTALTGKLETDLRSMKADLSSSVDNLRTSYTEQYIHSVDNLFDYVKTLSVITSVMGKESDVMRHQLMLPALREKWQKEHEDRIAKLNETVPTLGSWLLSQRKELHDKLLLFERTGKNTEELKGRLAQLDELLEKSNAKKTT